MAELAKRIVVPLTQAQTAAAEAAIEAAMIQAEAKERIVAKSLAAPLVWVVAIAMTLLAAYVLYLRKEARLLDLAEVAIGGAVGYFAGKKKVE